MANSIGTFSRIFAFQNVPIPTRKMNPVGIEISSVVSMNSGRMSGLMPETNRWCCQTKKDKMATPSRPAAMILYPNSGLRQNTGTISETMPTVAGGAWHLRSAQCDGAALPATLPVQVTVAAGVAAPSCTLVNEFVPSGELRIAAVSYGGLVRKAFQVDRVAGGSADEDPFHTQVQAQTGAEGVAAPAERGG